ncbi:hypothetical protein JMI89_01495 [Frischella sp. Ac48]|uniref:Uncharacterized protein n=1 Tax=Frischella japonica TaxID=2741544 RepID=A0ABR7QWA5_9GAMM|nr:MULTISPECIES: hypothetical protein [Frischella]MBC9130483.1 hypothetical protein [Frischella japonica]MBX4132306.1 hypothetical protein [Frischella sp. Ac48]
MKLLTQTEFEIINNSSLLKYLQQQERLFEKFEQDNLLTKAIEMLKMWGICNAYSSRSGFKSINSMFRDLYPKKTLIFVENEIEFIDQCMLEAKNSKQKSLREQQKIAEYYYKGIDLVIDGKDWSQRLTLCEIAEVLEQSKSTIHRKLRAFDSFIVSKLANFDNLDK